MNDYINASTHYIEIWRDLNMAITPYLENLYKVALVNQRTKKITPCGIFTEKGISDWLYYYRKYGVMLKRPIPPNNAERSPPR